MPKQRPPHRHGNTGALPRGTLLPPFHAWPFETRWVDGTVRVLHARMLFTQIARRLPVRRTLGHDKDMRATRIGAFADQVAIRSGRSVALRNMSAAEAAQRGARFAAKARGNFPYVHPFSAEALSGAAQREGQVLANIVEAVKEGAVQVAAAQR